MGDAAPRSLWIKTAPLVTGSTANSAFGMPYCLLLTAPFAHYILLALRTRPPSSVDVLYLLYFWHELLVLFAPRAFRKPVTTVQPASVRLCAITCGREWGVGLLVSPIVAWSRVAISAGHLMDRRRLNSVAESNSAHLTPSDPMPPGSHPTSPHITPPHPIHAWWMAWQPICLSANYIPFPSHFE